VANEGNVAIDQLKNKVYADKRIQESKYMKYESQSPEKVRVQSLNLVIGQKIKGVESFMHDTSPKIQEIQLKPVSTISQDASLTLPMFTKGNGGYKPNFSSRFLNVHYSKAGKESTIVKRFLIPIDSNQNTLKSKQKKKDGEGKDTKDSKDINGKKNTQENL